MGPQSTEVPMRCLVTFPITLPPSNARFEVPAGIGGRIAARISARVAARVAAWSSSACFGLLAAFLILATCAPTSASAYRAVERPGPATPLHARDRLKTVIDVRT